MGDLEHIGKELKWGTRAFYEAKKAQCLAALDPQTEYAVQGKIFCLFCRKEKSVDMPEYNFYTKSRICDCTARAEEAERRRAERNMRLSMYRAENDETMPADTRGAKFIGIIPQGEASEDYITICERCEKFCRNFPSVKESGRGIWIYGNADAGKTYLASAIANQLQENGVSVLFTTVERILERFKASYAKEAKETEQFITAKYSSVECLILDDFKGIKTTRATKENWAAEKFGEIIKRRYEKKLPTVITSRESMRDMSVNNNLPKEISEKLLSRQVTFFVTGNRRKPVQQEIEF